MGKRPFSRRVVISMLMRCKTFIPQTLSRPALRAVVLTINILTLIIFMSGCKTAPVTEQEAMTVRATVDRAIANADTGPLIALMDTKELARRVSAKAKGISEKGLREALGDGKNMGEFYGQMMTAVTAGRSLRFVRAYQDGATWHLLYRMFGDGLNYFDWELIRDGTEVKIADVLVYVSGENLSETVASAADPSLGLGTGNQVLPQEIRKLRGLMNQGDYEQAEVIYNSWPPSARQHRLIRIIHTQILSGLEKDKEYADELEKLAVDFPDSRNVPLLMIDVYFLQKNPQKALEAINRLDKLVGGDPFLEFYRAQVAQERGDTGSYYRLVRKAFATEKDIDAVAIEMMYVSVLTGDTATLDAAENAFRSSKNYDPEVRSKLQLMAKMQAMMKQ